MGTLVVVTLYVSWPSSTPVVVGDPPHSAYVNHSPPRTERMVANVPSHPHVSSDFPFHVFNNHVFVVVGIPTTDTTFGRQRRDWQRGSWFTYPEVVGRGDIANPQRAMLVRYLIGRHPDHGFKFSDELIDEQQANEDIIALNMKEGKPVTGKKSGGAGYWGLESEVGMSRKALMWYRIAFDLFSSDYAMKCDDDVFIRVPQYLADLRQLPRERLYWGKVMKWGAIKGDPRSKFYFVGGMSITLSRDLLWEINRYNALQKLVGTFDPSFNYKEHNMDHEDVMIGRVFFNLKTNVTVVKDCRFHDVHVGANVKPIQATSVAIHHLGEGEYGMLMKRFENSVIKTTFRASTARPYHTALSPC